MKKQTNSLNSAPATDIPLALQVLEQLDNGVTYIACETTKQLTQVIGDCKQFQYLAFDTETTGTCTATARCLGYSFSVEPHKAFWVPIVVDPQMKLLQKLFAKKHLILFNAVFDLAIVQNHIGKRLDNEFSDMMVACFFRDTNGYEKDMGLKAQGHLLFQSPTIEMKDILKANKGVKTLTDDEIHFTDLLPDQQRIYGCQDADLTLQLWQHPEIQAAIAWMPEIWKLEHRLIPVVMKMQQNGLKVDVAILNQLDTLLETACQTAQVEIARMVQEQCPDGHAELTRLMGKKKEINLGSPDQKRIILFDIFGLSPVSKTDTGRYSTDQDTLEALRGQHPIVDSISQYARFRYRRNNYTSKLPLLVNPVTNRIHPSLWSTGARSGRFSCTRPNMQGISGDKEEDSVAHIREAFVPERGNVLTDADYSQIELRIAASLSGEPILFEAYLQNEDVHTKMAQEMFHVKKPTDYQRLVAKTANFEILYGISPHSFFAKNRKVIPSIEFAAETIDNWFAVVPRLAEWIDRTKQDARITQQTVTYFGRVRPLPGIRQPSQALINQRMVDFRQQEWAKEIDSGDLYDRAVRSIIGSLERKAVSHVIQGTAADILKIALVKVDTAIEKSKMPVKMLLTVHDEILFEHPSKYTKRIQKLVKSTMELNLGNDWVPIIANVKSGKSWAQAE